VGVHALLILVAFFAGPAIMKVMNVNDNIEIIRSSVRVDVVGMPKFTIKELREMQSEATKAEPAPVEKPKEEIKAQDDAEDEIKKDDIVIQEKGESKKKKASFLNLLSDYSSKKVAPREKKQGSKDGKGTDLNSLVIEGNRLSKGGALVGDYSDGENSEFSEYVQGLPESIRPFWNLPSYLKDKGFKCRIRVFVSASGQLLKVEVYESSGQSEYDARAEKAVRDASPFPAPSAAVGARLTKFGIILGFPL
jgi:TonB family protein